jgi:hypothetical protein
MDETDPQAQALAAIAAGAAHPTIVNGAAPPSANGNSPQQPAAAPAQPQPQPAQADQPIKGDQTALEVQVAQLRDELANARKVNRVLATTLLATLVLLLIATQAPDAIPNMTMIRRPEVPLP